MLNLFTGWRAWLVLLAYGAFWLTITGMVCYTVIQVARTLAPCP